MFMSIHQRDGELPNWAWWRLPLLAMVRKETCQWGKAGMIYCWLELKQQWIYFIMKCDLWELYCRPGNACSKVERSGLKLVRKGGLNTLIKQSVRGTLKIVRDLKIDPNVSDASRCCIGDALVRVKVLGSHTNMWSLWESHSIWIIWKIFSGCAVLAVIQSYTRDQLGTGPKNPAPGESHFKRQSDVTTDFCISGFTGPCLIWIHRSASHLTVWIHRGASSQTWISNFRICSKSGFTGPYLISKEFMHRSCMINWRYIVLLILVVGHKGEKIILDADSPAGYCNCI